MKVGHKIREIREGKKFSQETMAEALGLSVNGYGKIERNEVDINIERLQQIAQTLEVAPEEIIRENNPVFNNYGTAQDKSFSIIHEYSAKLEKLYEDKTRLYEDKIKLLEDKIAWLEKR